VSVQMSVSGPTNHEWRISSVRTFKIVQADRDGRLTFWVTPGWYRRSDSPEGVISLIPIRRWRLWRHRLLWGFSGLVDGR
jgi:hypothetical protein